MVRHHGSTTGIGRQGAGCGRQRVGMASMEEIQAAHAGHDQSGGGLGVAMGTSTHVPEFEEIPRMSERGAPDHLKSVSRNRSWRWRRTFAGNGPILCKIHPACFEGGRRPRTVR